MLDFQAGRREAFEQLVRRNTPRVHALVWRFLGAADRALVEDLTQETFLRVLRAADRYRPRARFSTWLYRIVANLCFNAQRELSRRRARPAGGAETGENPLDALPDTRLPGPAQQAAGQELAEHVGRAISELPDTQRMAFLLSRYEHKSCRQIAEILDSSPKAVKSLLHRARENLRQALGGYLRGEGDGRSTHDGESD
jgi:RNA polymerase sigma-70 factor (ECF subfamily)